MSWTPRPSGKRRRAWRAALILRDGERCAYCGAEAVQLTFDHVVPRDAGGRSVLANLVLACSTCNQDKGTLSAEGFAEAAQMRAENLAAAEATMASLHDASQSTLADVWPHASRQKPVEAP